MWRIAMIILLTAAASGQAISNPGPPQAVAGVQSAGLCTAEARALGRYDKLRRGRDEQMAIFEISPQSSCAIYPGSLDAGVRLYLKSLRLEPKAGFSIRYGDGRKFKTQPMASAIATNGGDAFLLQLKASPDLPAGEYTIKGRVGFVTVEGNKPSADEIDVTLPVTVVDHDAVVTKNSWPFQPYRDHSLRDKLEIIALAPVLPFYFIYLEIACRNGGCE